MELLRQASTFALLSLAIDVVPLIMALVYVARPTEHHLALMRPVSLAGIFAALSGGVLGFVNVLRGIGMTPTPSPESYRIAATGASEALVAVFVGFASLAVAWLLVAVGMSRGREEV
jgi:hypothetical protein